MTVRVLTPPWVIVRGRMDTLKTVLHTEEVTFQEGELARGLPFPRLSAPATKETLKKKTRYRPSSLSTLQLRPGQTTGPHSQAAPSVRRPPCQGLPPVRTALRKDS